MHSTVCTAFKKFEDVLCRLHSPAGLATVHPPLDEFTDMPSNLFAGSAVEPERPEVLEDELFTLQELQQAIRALKSNKAANDCGLAAELLHHARQPLLQNLLGLFNHVFTTGDVPSAWRKTFFRILARFPKAKMAGDYRAIASLRLLYKVFAYIRLHRMEPLLETEQPEERLGFKASLSDLRAFTDPECFGRQDSCKQHAVLDIEP